MSPTLRTLSGETQRIAAKALAKGTLSHEEMRAAVLLYKVQRDDARKDAATFRVLLAEVISGWHGKLDAPIAAEIRAALVVAP